jgi:hypothetical protein
MTDFRELCAELHAAFNTYAVDEVHHALLERARAALTEPKPPSLKDQALDRCNDYIDPDGIIRRALEALDD